MAPFDEGRARRQMRAWTQNLAGSHYRRESTRPLPGLPSSFRGVILPGESAVPPSQPRPCLPTSLTAFFSVCGEATTRHAHTRHCSSGPPSVAKDCCINGKAEWVQVYHRCMNTKEEDGWRSAASVRRFLRNHAPAVGPLLPLAGWRPTSPRPAAPRHAASAPAGGGGGGRRSGSHRSRLGDRGLGVAAGPALGLGGCCRRCLR